MLFVLYVLGKNVDIYFIARDAFPEYALTHLNVRRLKSRTISISLGARQLTNKTVEPN